MSWKFSNKNQGVPRDFLRGGTGAAPRTKIEFRKDTATNRVLCTPADGEPFWDTTDNSLYIGDGSTAGGVLISTTSASAYKAKVTSADTTGGYLQAKLLAGTNITITKDNAGANETLTFAASGAGDVSGPASSTDNALARFDQTTGKLLQDGQITQSDVGELARVASISGVNDATGYTTWADATAYVVGNKRQTSNPEGGIASYNCILNHTSDADRDWPGYGELWETYWESLDEIMHLKGPIVVDDNLGMNRGQLREVSQIRFVDPDGNGYVNFQCPTLASNSRYVLPDAAPGSDRLCLMVDTLSGNKATLYWSTPGLDEVIGSFGTDGQYLVSNGTDTIAWTDRPYDPTIWVSGIPSSGLVVWSARVVRKVHFAANFSGSYATALNGATLSAVFNVYKATGLGSFSLIGTITFAAAGNGAVQAGTFSTSGAAVDLAVGDRLEIVAPASSDATLQDIAIDILGSLPS